MSIAISVIGGIALIIYSLIHYIRNRKKEGFKKSNVWIPLISGLLLLIVSFPAASASEERDQLQKKYNKVSNENADLNSKVNDLQAQLDEAKAQAKNTAAKNDESSKDEETDQAVTTVSEPEKPKTTTLGTGSFYVGKDIDPGRYTVSTQSQFGNFFVYDENGIPTVNEILGTDSQAVNNVTVDLKDGQKIEISGIQSVTFSPK